VLKGVGHWRALGAVKSGLLRLILSNERNEIEAHYTNHLGIGQNSFEFVLDFGQFYAGDEKTALVHTRIVTSPFYAKCFSDLLKESLRRYEDINGPIPDEGPNATGVEP
jgi:hypothetical protein